MDWIYGFSWISVQFDISLNAKYLHTIFSSDLTLWLWTLRWLFFIGTELSLWLQVGGNNQSQMEKKEGLALFFSLSSSSPPMQFSWSVGLHIMHENEITSSVQWWRQRLHKTSLCLNMIPSLLISNIVLPHPQRSTRLRAFTDTIFISWAHFTQDLYVDAAGSV